MKGFIDKAQFHQVINSIPKSLYREYLERIAIED